MRTWRPRVARLFRATHTCQLWRPTRGLGGRVPRGGPDPPALYSTGRPLCALGGLVWHGSSGPHTHASSGDPPEGLEGGSRGGVLTHPRSTRPDDLYAHLAASCGTAPPGHTHLPALATPPRARRGGPAGGS